MESYAKDLISFYDGETTEFETVGTKIQYPYIYWPAQFSLLQGDICLGFMNHLVFYILIVVVPYTEFFKKIGFI